MEYGGGFLSKIQSYDAVVLCHWVVVLCHTLSLGGGTSHSSLGGWWIRTGGTIFVIGWVVVLSLEIILIKGVGLEVGI